MSLKVATRLITFEPHKIADLQENDTTTHIEDVSSFLPPGTKAIIISPERVSGTGDFHVYPSSGTTFVKVPYLNMITNPIKNRELKWKNSVTNDDWDIYLSAYFVEVVTR